MHFTSLVAASALFATLTPALPTLVAARDAGPSGSVVSPVGDTHYPIGAAIHFQYQGVSTDEVQTNSVDVRLVTFEGKETYNANNISLGSFITAPDGSTFIDAWFRASRPSSRATTFPPATRGSLSSK